MGSWPNVAWTGVLKHMRIPEEKVEEVKAATDIVEVVGDYVRLKKAGSNYKGLCPFHDEKTPSFNVNPSIGIYKCFGCGEGGDVIAFVEKVEGLGFVEAVRALAERAGVELPQEDSADPVGGEMDSLLHALRFAARFYFRQLTQTDEGRQQGLEYFKGRGFSAETIKTFGLGYAPDGWDSLLEAARAEQLKPEVLERAGLVLARKSGDGHYDRFRGRVMFPIVSQVGKVLGFGGRVIGPADDQPKYVNSPETLHQAGVENVVAASGTALSTEQVRLIGRYASRVVLLFDADSAGAAAALRSIEVVLREGLAAYVVSLPERADPDSFVRQFGAEAFRQYARNNRKSFVAFQVDHAKRAGLMDTPEGQMEAARSVFQAIAQIPREPRFYVMWEGYVRQAAQLLGIPDMHLRRQFPELLREAQPGAVTPAGRQPRPRPAVPVPPRPQSPLAMRPEEGALIRLMLEHGAPMIEFVLGHMAVEEFTAGPVRTTVEHLLAQYQESRIEPRRFVSGEYGAEIQQIATGVQVDRHTLSANWQRQHNIRVPSLNHDPFESASSSMTLLKLDRVNEAILARQQALYVAEQAGEDTRPHLLAMQELNALRSRIERREFLADTDATQH
jgi:DNA primase